MTNVTFPYGKEHITYDFANEMENKLEILFLGTCAADFSPKLKEEYKGVFDLDARRSSSMLINGKYLVDCGPHTLDSIRIAGVDCNNITDIFMTHLHDDHFCTENIEIIAKGRKSPLCLWIREDAPDPHIENVEIKRISAFTEKKVGESVALTGLLANHEASSYPLHLLIKIGEKQIFYGCDGGWLINQTYEYLKRKELDAAILDCTVGDYLGDYRIAEHNCIPMLRVMLPSLMTEKIITEKTSVIFSHIAPSLHKPHTQTAEIVREMGAALAYDGMKLII